MTDLTHFERQEEEVGPFSSYEEKFAWACGYNDCLSQTNAKELYEVLSIAHDELVIAYKNIGAAAGMSSDKVDALINGNNIITKIKAALSKPTEKPQP